MWEPEAKGKKSGILILSPLMIIVIEMSLLAHCWDTVLPRRPEGMGLIPKSVDMKEEMLFHVTTCIFHASVHNLSR